MELLFLGLIGGAIASFFIFKRFAIKKDKKTIENQSVVLLDKIKKVSKLITVEGEFAEIYHHENTQDNFWGLFSSRKKAIILVNAKVHIGFDFRKIKMHSDNKKKTIVITEFPEPELFSIEPNIKFYDIQDGFLNKFNSEDLTKVNQEAKDFIVQKIPESNLMQTANHEALEAISLMENLVQTIGWKLDYAALELPAENSKMLDK